METPEMRAEMLDMMGEVYLLAPTATEFKMIAGKDTRAMADYHSPYDAEVQNFIFVTTEDEVTRVVLKNKSVFAGQTSGRTFTVLNVSPDETFWAVVTASWDSPNI